jgi:hypothetical protein
MSKGMGKGKGKGKGSKGMGKGKGKVSNLDCRKLSRQALDADVSSSTNFIREREA